MPRPTVLITGAGITGPVCAFWLNRAGIQTTIVERAPALRTAGQQIDLRGAGLEVVRRMGLYDDIKSRTVKEEGLTFVDKRGTVIGEFPVTEDSQSFTAEVEIIRSDLVQVFYNATKSTTRYIFGDHVTAITQPSAEGGKVKVDFGSNTSQEFDMVLGADGMGSKTRRLVFPDEDHIKSLGQFMAFFTIPFEEADGRLAKWYNAPGGRCIMNRPDGKGCTRAYLSIMSSVPRERGYANMTMPEQKALIRELFEDAGWVTPRVLQGMDASADFYMQETAQVKMSAWSKGSVALMGDAAYCPSPISGMGTTLAVVGGYVLAGEIAQARVDGQIDVKAALRGYEATMRPIVTKAQALPPGAPGIVNPQTALGIKVLNTVVGFVSWSGITRYASKLGGGEKAQAKAKALPAYEFSAGTSS